jgi:bacterioferritin-associated ferredoxin
MPLRPSIRIAHLLQQHHPVHPLRLPDLRGDGYRTPRTSPGLVAELARPGRVTLPDTAYSKAPPRLSRKARTDEPGTLLQILLFSGAVSEILHPAVRKLTTVCRCNNIKYGTIERAIDAGARTVSEVGAATLATTGRCGGSCTPRVMEMIEARWPSAPRVSAEVSRGNASDWWIRTCEACGGGAGECGDDSSCSTSGTD